MIGNRVQVSWTGWRRCFALGMLAFAFAGAASAQVNTQKSAEIVAWAASNLKTFQADVSFAGKLGQAVGPTPPEVNPPCHVCGDTTPTNGEAQVSAWLQSAMNPELAKFGELTTIMHQAALYGQIPQSTLSGQAQTALAQFSESSYNQAITKLANHLVQKSYDTSNRYDSNSKMAYAGIQFLLQAAHNADLMDAGSAQFDDQSIEYAKTWAQSVVSDIDNRVLNGHQYNLCPVYAELVHQLALLGGDVDIDQFQQMLTKLQNEVKFDVKVNLSADSGGTDTFMHAAWTGKAKLTLKLDLANSCYTPQFDNGGQMNVNVTKWSMQGMDEKSNGHKDPVQFSLTSSRSYTVTLGTPQLDLCDPQPIFQMPAPTSEPPGTIVAKGKSTKETYFSDFMGAVIATNEINTSATNAVTGQTPSVPGGGSSTSSSTSSSDPGASVAVSQLQQQINAHRSDVTWLMSSQGQAAIAALQDALFHQVQPRLAAAGVVAPNANNFAQLGASLGSAHLNWSNGQSQPVNQTLHVKKDNTSIVLTISLQQSQ